MKTARQQDVTLLVLDTLIDAAAGFKGLKRSFHKTEERWRERQEGASPVAVTVGSAGPGGFAPRWCGPSNPCSCCGTSPPAEQSQSHRHPPGSSCGSDIRDQRQPSAEKATTQNAFFWPLAWENLSWLARDQITPCSSVWPIYTSFCLPEISNQSKTPFLLDVKGVSLTPKMKSRHNQHRYFDLLSLIPPQKSGRHQLGIQTKLSVRCSLVIHTQNHLASQPPCPPKSVDDAISSGCTLYGNQMLCTYREDPVQLPGRPW